MSHKKHSLKEIIIPFLPFVVLYFLFNYLPIEHWVGSEIIYLLIKFAVYAISAAGVIYFKHKLHVEIEVPQRQISLLWLLPLLVICFANPIYTAIFQGGPIFKEEIEWGILAADAGIDILVSIVEDILFVDLLISILLEVFKHKKYKRITSIFVAAILFTAAHSYTFIYKEWQEAVIILITVFFLIVECGYLAIYFDSPVIPIVAHAIFNELNFVIIEQVSHVNVVDKGYVTFTILLLALTSCYLGAIYNLSTLQKYRPNAEEFDE